MLIILGGLPGVGKTTVARGVARRVEAVHIRIDTIEAAIRESGVTVVSLDDAGYRVAYGIAEDNLRLGRTVIADSVNPLPITRSAWREVAALAQVPALEVELICSNQDEHRRRVEQRLADTPGQRGPTWRDVGARDYRPWDRQHLVIDTAVNTIDQSVAMLVSMLPRMH
jgi:predicted kinase